MCFSKIELRGGEGIGVQVDRIIRDIQWKGSDYGKRVPPDRVSERPLEVVSYMRWARVKEMMEYAGAKVLSSTLAYGKKKDDRFCSGPAHYAADTQENFPFFGFPEQTTFGDLSPRIVR